MAVPTTQEIIERGWVSAYLIGNNNSLGALFGSRIAAPGSMLTITMVTYGLKWGYDGGAQTSAALKNVGNYLIWLMGAFGQQAEAIISGGGGGSVIPGGGVTNIYPFVITSSDFESDGVSYNNTAIVGDNITLFINEYNQQWIYAGAGNFSYTATGIIITIPGFDANVNSWTIQVQKLNS